MEDLRSTHNALLETINDEQLWLRQTNPSAEPNSAPFKSLASQRTSSSEIQFTPRTVIKDFDSLPRPRQGIVGKGEAPPIPPVEEVKERDDYRRTSASNLVKSILRGIVNKHGEDVVEWLLDDSVPETVVDIPEERPLSASQVENKANEEGKGELVAKQASRIPSFFLLRKVLPVLVPGLEELLRQSTHSAEARRLGAGRRPIQPLDWLGMYLMRHNPNICSKTITSPTDSYKLTTLTRIVLDDMMMARKARQRSVQWKTKSVTTLQDIWREMCPEGETEVIQEHMTQSINEISALLGFGGRFTDAEELFSLMDIDESGSVSYSEFEEAMTDLLEMGERINQEQLDGQGKNEEFKGWAYRAAEKKLTTRTERHNVTAQELFKQYSDQQDGETENHIGLIGVLKSVDAIREVLYGSKDTHLRHTEEVLSLARDSRVSFQDFEAIITKEIDMAARKFDKSAQKKAREMAEKQARQDRENHESLMKQIDELDKKGAIASKGIEHAVQNKERANSSATAVTNVCIRLDKLSAKLGNLESKPKGNDEKLLIEAFKKVHEQVKSADVKVSESKSHSNEQLQPALKLKRQASSMLHGLKQSIRSHEESPEASLLECVQVVNSLGPAVESAIASTRTFHKIALKEGESATKLGRLAGELSALINAVGNLNQLIESLGTVQCPSPVIKREELLLEFKQRVRNSGDEISKLIPLLSEVKWTEGASVKNVTEFTVTVLNHVREVSSACQPLAKEIDSLDQQFMEEQEKEENAFGGEKSISSIDSINEQSSVSTVGDAQEPQERQQKEGEAPSPETEQKEEHREVEKVEDENVDVPEKDGDDRPKSRGKRGKRKKKQYNPEIKKGALSSAAKSSNLANLLELLKNGADPNEKDRNGSTPLVHLAWPGNVEGSRMLLAFGADPLVANLRCNTAVHFAFERGHEELIKLLICNGGATALSMKNSLGKTPGKLNKSMSHMDKWGPTEQDLREFSTREQDYL